MDPNTLKWKRVIVTDVKMKFGSMVVFMIKWVIASIPAMIILALLSSAIFGFGLGLIKGLG